MPQTANPVRNRNYGNSMDPADRVAGNQLAEEKLGSADDQCIKDVDWSGRNDGIILPTNDQGHSWNRGASHTKVERKPVDRLALDLKVAMAR